MKKKYTENEKEILRLYSEGDENWKRLVLDLMVCAATCGEPFYKEMQELLEQGKKEEMREALKKWTETARTQR